MPTSRKVDNKLVELGARVKAIRKSKNLTLKQLAFSIDKDPQSVHRLEMGKINPSYLYLLDICKGLEIQITDLLKDL